MGYKVILSCTGYKVSILQVTVIPGITVACNSGITGDGLHGITDAGLQFSGITSEVLHGLLTCNP